MSAPLSTAAQQVLNKVLDAMLAAEGLGGPEGQDYVNLMARIAEEATTRAAIAKAEKGGAA